jgi:hypothetical protein
MEKSTLQHQNTTHNSIYYLHNGFMTIKNYKSENRFTNFKIHYMKTLLKISLAFIIFISYNNLFASGWQQKLDLINSSDRANNSEIEMMPNGNCIIASNFSQPWDTAIYLHQYKKENGEILLFNINYVFNKNVQKVHAIKYISSIQKYILIYEEYVPNNIVAGIYYQIIESFEPFVIQPKHLLYIYAYDDLYSNKLIVSETNSTIEAGFSTTKIDNVNNHVRDTIKFIRAKISFANLDTVAQIDSVNIPNKYASSSIQYALYTMKKVQNDYILNVSNLDNNTNVYYAKLIRVHADLSWDSAVVYYPNGFISPQLLNNGNLLIKNNFRQSSSNGGYSITDIYNSSMQKLFSIDSTSLPGNAAIFIEPSDGKVINIEGDYYPTQPTEYGMVREIIDINNRKATKQEIWHINYPDGISFRNFNIVSQTNFKDGYAYLFGLIAGPNNRNLYLIQIDSLGNVYNNLIRGNVIGDFDNDCAFDTGADVRMKNITITANIDTNVLFTSTDNDGNYQFATNSAGTVKIASRNNFRYPLWKKGACNDTVIVELTTSVSVDSVNFNFTPIVSCIGLTVDVALRRFRHLDPQIFYDVNYCNLGTVHANNAYIDIKVDPVLVVDFATGFGGNNIPFISLGNNVYRFDIVGVSIFDCSNFTVYLHEKPEAVLGQTVCIESHIYPDYVCVLPNYSNAIIVATAECLGDSVRLQLQNTGGNMQAPKKYIVIEDQVIRKIQDFQLPSNGTLAEMYPSDSGKTYRIIAEQPTDFPRELGDKYATAAIEGCRPNLEDPFSTGFITPFPNYDGAPYFSTDCRMIVGSFDPNEKDASPAGYSAQHFIEENTDINYSIHFQNTGNDTAYKVVVVDTIETTLDINTLIPLVASHDYRFERIDSNVVRFVFDSIYLVDSVHNEPLSHGFVKFSIQQKLNNPIGTKIYNNASIYFDRNEAVVTNTTFHTIGRDFIQMQLISSTKNIKYNVKEVSIFPNPFRDKAQIIVEANDLKNAVLVLMNLEGQIIKTIPSANNNMFTIYREDLANGMYLFKILEDNNEVTTGKLIAQ